jgi:hypothetical protein
VDKEEIGMNTLKSAVLSVLYSLLLLTTAFTQSIAVEDQIVIEDLTLSQLRREIKKIETEFYKVFNANTEDKNLAIVCYNHLPTGSNIKRDICEPQFVVDKRADNANDSQYDIDVLLTAQSMQRELTTEYAALSESMANLAKGNKYFGELNGILGALREELESR